MSIVIPPNPDKDGDTRAPKTPDLSSPCGAHFRNVGELMSHTQNHALCTWIQAEPNRRKLSNNWLFGERAVIG